MAKQNTPKKAGGGYFGKSFDAGAMRTGKQAKKYINATTRLEFNPLARQLKNEQRASSFRERQEIPAYFAQYQADLARLRGETQNAYTGAQNRIQQFADAGGAQDAANRAAIQQRLQADAQARGTNVDPSIDIGGADAEAARRNVVASTIGTVAGQGANQFVYNTNRQGIASQQGIEQRQTEAARSRKISSDQRALKKDKGAYKVQALDKLIESDRKYGLELKALRSDKQIAQMEERGQNARNAADNATSRANNDADNAATAKQKRKDRRHDTNQAKKDRDAERRENKKDRRADKSGKGKGKL